MYISQDELKELHKMFHECGPFFIALGEEIRQKIILDILDAGVDGLNVMTLTSMSHLSRPAISHHLKVLKDSGLVIAEKKGTQIFYKVSLSDSFLNGINLFQSTLGIIQRVGELKKKAGMTDGEFK